MSPPASSRRSAPPAADGLQDLTELASNLRLTVTRLSRRLRYQADAGISPSMLSALATVEHHQPVTLGDLAAHEGIQPPSVTRLAGRLEEAGLIERDVDPADRRITRVSLSHGGRRLLERARSRKTAYLARRLQGLPSEDRAALERARDVLDRMLEGDR